MSRITALALLAILRPLQAPAASVFNPSCTVKQDCNDIWAAPAISDCVDGFCKCTGGSEFIEQSKTCQCAQGFAAGPTGCVPELRKLSSSCNTQDECAKDLGELATCVLNECVCVSGAVPANGGCRKKKYLFASCEYDEECSHLENAICVRNNCTCEEDHRATPDHKSCVPMLKSLWDYCQHNIQCTEAFGEGSYCRTRCLCRTGHHEINNNQCIKDKVAGEQCSSDSECYDDRDVNIITMTCVNGRCVDPTAGNRPECKQTNGAHKIHLPTVIVVLTSIAISVLSS